MWKKTFLVLVCSLTVLTVGALSLTGLASKEKAHAAYDPNYCQCTTYVAQHYGFQDPHIWAYQWANNPSGWNLKNQGWTQDAVPSPGDIMVFQGNVGYGVNWEGHVGVIQGATRLSQHHWSISLLGANQGGSTHWEGNCDDVSTILFGNVYDGIGGGISYYYKVGVSR